VEATTVIMDVNIAADVEVGMMGVATEHLDTVRDILQEKSLSHTSFPLTKIVVSEPLMLMLEWPTAWRTSKN
jgi:hypothetical protein